MIRFLAIGALLAAILPAPARAIDYHPFASFGIGLTIMDDQIRWPRVYPGIGTRPPRMNQDPEDDQVFELEAQSEAGLGITLDGGVALLDMWRVGSFISYGAIFDKKYPLSVNILNPEYDRATDTNNNGTDGDMDRYRITQTQVFDFRGVHQVMAGAFVGMQFNLGKGTPTSHYLYVDYGFGWTFVYSEIKHRPDHKSSSLAHMVRFGIDIPLPVLFGFSGLGAGVEFQWVEPQDNDITNFFSLMVKTSYRF